MCSVAVIAGNRPPGVDVVILRIEPLDQKTY